MHRFTAKFTTRKRYQVTNKVYNQEKVPRYKQCVYNQEKVPRYQQVYNQKNVPRYQQSVHVVGILVCFDFGFSSSVFIVVCSGLC